MSSVVRFGSAAFLVWHGLIHLLYVAAYWKLAEMEQFPYKTALLNGRWEIGESGIRLFGGLWLVAAIGFVIAAIGLGTKQDWLPPVLVAVALLSLVISALDWNVAYGGVGIGLVIVLAVIVGPKVV
jgi:hypothetical protein